MRVVLIDDVLSNLIFMRQLVRQLGENTILDFTNPLKALAVLRRHSADLILVDYRMPGMDGITFIREVRAISGLEDIPILMVTTSEDREVLLAALDAGAT